MCAFIMEPSKIIVIYGTLYYGISCEEPLVISLSNSPLCAAQKAKERCATSDLTFNCPIGGINYQSFRKLSNEKPRSCNMKWNISSRIKIKFTGQEYEITCSSSTARWEMKTAKSNIKPVGIFPVNFRTYIYNTNVPSSRKNRLSVTIKQLMREHGCDSNTIERPVAIK